MNVMNKTNIQTSIACRTFYQLHKGLTTLDDFKQAADIGLYKAYCRYDKDKGNFEAYASYYIKAEIYDMYRKENGSFPLSRREYEKLIKENKLPETVSEDEIKDLTDSYSVEHEVETKELQKDIRETISTLPEQEQKVIKMKYGIDCDPLPVSTISKKLNISPKAVNKTEALALRKLRNPKRSRKLFYYLN